VSHPTTPKQWLPAAAAVGLLGTVVFAGVALGRDDSSPEAVPASTTTLTVPASVPEVIATVATSAPVEKTVLDRTLTKGVTGADVKAVQDRLTSLGFVPGPADGIYGDETIKAVWAYEKLVLGAESSNPSGEVTPEMWDELQEPFVIQPRRPDSTPNHTEVYLPEQVLAVFQDDVPVLITHMSSGTGEKWCEEVTISPGEQGNREGTEPLKRGECGRSNTPGGVFEFYRQVEGIRESALGSMWNPVYFNYGIAIHGALNVPLQPASHGCIRIPLGISENLQSLLELGDQVFVWDGVKEPEEYGAQQPTWNTIDPDYVTTTTTTIPESTTTVPESSTTVVAPPTTIPAPPVAPPPTTVPVAPPPATSTTVPTPPPTEPVP
jgi:L,D-transpeptidase catalytic domain/Putative peptidoglycan binding domain